MSEFLVRLKGKQKEYIDKLINEGYFKTKSEIVRLGIIEVSKKYLDNNSKELYELNLVKKAIERDLKILKDNKEALYSEKDFKKKYGKYL